MRPMSMGVVLRSLNVPVLLIVMAGCGATDAAGGRAGASASPSAAYDWAQDCGVEYYKHLPHNPSATEDHSYEADEYVGLPLEEAEARAKAAGLELRVLGVDGDCTDRTDDLRANRVNFYVENQVVRAAARF